jgi:hypothetical protein
MSDFGFQMHLLFTIPHFAQALGVPTADGRMYGSRAVDLEPRVHALTASLTGLHQLFGAQPCFIDHARSIARQHQRATPQSVEIVICTTRGCHVLDRLPVDSRYYSHHPTNAEPLLLGYACHSMLRERLGQYDYYCYLEDDLVLHDPWFFAKLAWFVRHTGDDKLLQPNRFEAGLNHIIPKVYVDGEVKESATAPFQNVNDGALAGEVLGVPVVFRRTSNPHSGCFFLNAAQMAHWAAQPYFADNKSRFIGPLESAATLGIMRTFKVYRPAPANADFLEVEHFGTGYLSQLTQPQAEGC